MSTSGDDTEPGASGSGAGSQTITKLMSLTLAEFAVSASRLAGREMTGGEVVLALPGGGNAQIACVPVAGVTLGGLLALPRANVTIAFTADTTPASRAAFMKRFDLAFQRGGG